VAEFRQSLGFCPQQDMIYQNLTVYQHLRFIQDIKYKENTQEIEQLVEQLGLTQELEKSARELSACDKRKLSLAMALVGGSRLIFIDEPTSGLDSASRESIWNIFRSIRGFELENGMKRTMVITTNDLEEAEEFADRIALLHNGIL
jgi:ABC-type multidrug transport system ATPase subunit